jgi:hypothetical protein
MPKKKQIIAVKIETPLPAAKRKGKPGNPTDLQKKQSLGFQKGRVREQTG